MARLGRSLPGVHVWSRPTVISGPPNYIRVTLVVAANSVSARTRTDYQRRVVKHFLRPPTVVGAPVVFIADPISVELVQARPRPTTARLRPPITLQVFPGPRVAQVKVRPRPTVWDLRPPQVIRVPSVEQREQTITTRLVAGRRPKTIARLYPPTVLRVFTGPVGPLVRTRPRPTTAVLSPPATLEPAAVAQVERTLRTRLARGRAGKTLARLSRPTVLQVFPGPRTALVRSRPRPTTARLRPPTSLQVFSRPPARLVAARPRPTTHKLFPAATLASSQIFQGPRTTLARPFGRSRTTYVMPRVPVFSRGPVHLTISVLEVRNRPPATYARLFPPQVVTAAAAVVYPGPSVRTVRTRPRHTTYVLRRPTVLRVFSGPRATLTKTRPRPTTARLRPPTTLQVFSGPRATLAKARPRPTTKKLGAPVVVRVPSVEQLQQTLRTELARIRPRPTLALLRPPEVVSQPPAFLYPLRVQLAQIRPPRTLVFSIRPATLEPASVALDERTIRVQLARIKPQPTAAILRPPVVVAVPVAVTELLTKLVQTRPRPTHSILRSPAPVRPEVTRILTRLVQTRPRPTASVLQPPATLEPASVQQAERTIRVRLAPSRRPVTHSRLSPPVFIRGVETLRRSLAPPGRRFVHSVLRPPAVIEYPPPVVTQIYIRLAVPIPRTSYLTKLRPPTGTRSAPGESCLTDHAAFESCLTDQAAAEACLTDQSGEEAVSTLTDQATAVSCLTDVSAAIATLRDKE